jgi:hypothetical protein
MAVTAQLDVAAFVRPMPGELVAGDATVVRELDDGLLISIVDVLGHGAEAHEFAVQIEAFFAATTVSDPAMLADALHARFRGARGAAVGICHLRHDGVLSYVGHGNTSARRLWRQPVRMVSRDGTIGAQIRSSAAQTVKLEAGDVMVLHTDGVKDRFELADYRHLISDPARSIARNVVHMFGKDHDDAACIAIKRVD